MPNDTKGAVTVKEFCELYRLGHSKVYEMIAARELRAHKVGSRTIILAADVRAWEKSLMVKE